MPKRYLIFCDKRFLRIAIKELSEAYPKLEVKSIDPSERFLVASSETAIKPAADLVFTDVIAPISVEIEDKKYDSKEVLDALHEVISKPDKFKIEAVNLISHSGANAKTIEVFLGQRLEKEGQVADLKQPSVIIYVILAGGNIYICKMKDNYALDAFRENKFEKGEKISRAEFKLKEAIGYFGIDSGRIKLALDIGAAPGGWSNYMAKLGAKVIAVDNAALMYEKLDMKKIIHVNKKAQDLDLDSIRALDFDILLMDMNIAPAESAKLAIRFADILKKGTYLILTVKLIDLEIEKHMRDVSGVLSPQYGNIKFKKLPHNRMELTLFAIKK